jgi:hypothetical protein
MSCDPGDTPLPYPPVSPNFTQGHPMSPKAGVPGKPGFGLLGWKVTQADVPGKPNIDSLQWSRALKGRVSLGARS